MTEPSGPSLREHLLLFGRFLRSPRAVGAVAPSSRALACEMVHDLDPVESGCVVELGPGTGVFTRQIVARLSPQAHYLVVEIDEAFVARIRATWPQVDCVRESAEDLERLVRERHLPPVEHIISGLPFASLPGAVTTRILDAIQRTLAPGGTFTTFQYVHAYVMPAAVHFRRDLTARLGSAPERRLVMSNVPPAYVLTWRASRPGRG
jgi:phosphatidylethanolamine/phosphatidyl-N-methylethanolamine N-methyltransferase